MRIRNQLILALFLLTVVPLAGIVLFSYVSSRQAVREAVEQEAAELTREMEERVAEIGADLNRRVERVGAMRVWSSLASETGERDSAVGMVLSELGEVAPLLRSLEFVPAEAPPKPPRQPEPATAPKVGADPAARPVVITAPPAPPGKRPPTPWVIDFSKAMESLEEEMDLELPAALRKRLVEGLRVGAEEARQYSLEVIQDFELDGGDLESRLGEFTLRLEEDEERRAQLQLQEHELQSRAMASHREYLRHREREQVAASPVEVPVQVEVPIHESGEMVGRFRAQISPKEILYRVLERTRRDQGEIPFAIDQTGNLVTLKDKDRNQLEELPVGKMASGSPVPADIMTNWVVVTRQEPTSGLTFGIARPIRESLERVKNASARNFGYGMALIGLAILGILPLSRRMTRGLHAVTESAEKVARGDLKTRVPVTGRGEIGQLANAFNRMAHDLEKNQAKLVEEARLRHAQEIRQKVLEAEYERKTAELEEARRFQLSLLPRELPKHPAYEVAVAMRTATEVGGDYYDFRTAPDGALVAAVGDATGHGARAGTMVTVVKSLFSAHPPGSDLGSFLGEANETVRKMELGRMAMALCLARFENGGMRYASAGMPPALVRRADSGNVEELASPGMPLGGLADGYPELELELASGDLVVLMSDGLPELPDADGEPLGYERVAKLVSEAPSGSPQELIEGLLVAAEQWAGSGPPNDDITFVALRAR
jgi:serine phosphatase RsbU (regulator of sigma subunit)